MNKEQEQKKMITKKFMLTALVSNDIIVWLDKKAEKAYASRSTIIKQILNRAKEADNDE